MAKIGQLGQITDLNLLVTGHIQRLILHEHPGGMKSDFAIRVTIALHRLTVTGITQLKITQPSLTRF